MTLYMLCWTEGVNLTAFVEADSEEQAREMWDEGDGVVGEQGSRPFIIEDSLIVEATEEGEY